MTCDKVILLIINRNQSVLNKLTEFTAETDVLILLAPINFA